MKLKVYYYSVCHPCCWALKVCAEEEGIKNIAISKGRSLMSKVCNPGNLSYANHYHIAFFMRPTKQLKNFSKINLGVIKKKKPTGLDQDERSDIKNLSSNLVLFFSWPWKTVRQTV